MQQLEDTGPQEPRASRTEATGTCGGNGGGPGGALAGDGSSALQQAGVIQLQSAGRNTATVHIEGTAAGVKEGSGHNVDGELVGGLRKAFRLSCKFPLLTGPRGTGTRSESACNANHSQKAFLHLDHGYK